MPKTILQLRIELQHIEPLMRSRWLRQPAETLANALDPDHADWQRWAAEQKGIRGRFDPEAFDEQKVKFASPALRLKRLLAGIASRQG